jgi:predicted nuclease of predicted toxin-antitoxin system
MNPDDRSITDEELSELFSGDIKYPGEICFYLDENADQHLRSLWREGIGIITVQQQDQKTETSDIKILLRARELGCILITQDKHFKKIHERLAAIEKTRHTGIILLRIFPPRRPLYEVIVILIELAKATQYRPDILQNKLIQV